MRKISGGGSMKCSEVRKTRFQQASPRSLLTWEKWTSRKEGERKWS